ncbi:MAG: primosomal protein N' [bacterium]
MPVTAEKSNKEFAAVVVNLPARSIDRFFHYRLPPPLREKAVVGGRALVPFAGRKVEGYILGFVAEPDVADVKDIIRLLDTDPVVSPRLLQLARWLADYYLCSFVEALRCVLPAGLHQEQSLTVRLAVSADAAAAAVTGLGGKAPRQAAVLSLLQEKGEMSRAALARELGGKSLLPVIRALAAKGLVTTEESWMRGLQPKYATRVIPLLAPAAMRAGAERMRARAPRQAQALAAAAAYPDGVWLEELRTAAAVPAAAIRALADKGYLVCRREEVRRDPAAGRAVAADKPVTLTTEQATAVRAIEAKLSAGRPATVLLQGVTGSGKTEVYLRVISRAIASGRQAIVLVPEIALTPQTVERFRARFGPAVAVLHSRLGRGERYDEWRRIRDGAVSVVVGARSAVFAPFPHLGLIVIDEEQEASYKQTDNPKYHARDVAIERARLEKAVVVLGSATPSVRTYYRSLAGEFTLLRLTRRIDDRPLPPVEIIDMREELKAGNKSPFSRRLQAGIEACLAARQQAIIFLNRRGFSTFVLCRECGWVMRCPQCEVSLTYHAATNRLQCHYCDYSRPAPATCPRCRSHHIRYFGIGTERVETEVKKLFPAARVLRMDTDTTSRKGSHAAILNTFRKQAADILIGTQMIAKGLDFPHVTLVGVVTADTALHLPDYSAGERTFQLLTQVAGRAGRGEDGGNVIIQTYNPEHYSIIAARTHDYASFYREEIANRRELWYPPFGYLASILIFSESEERTITAAGRFGEIVRAAARKAAAATEILGPVPALLKKINGKYRWQIVLKGKERAGLTRLLRESRQAADEDAQISGVYISIDIEPVGIV